MLTSLRAYRRKKAKAFQINTVMASGPNPADSLPESCEMLVTSVNSGYKIAHRSACDKSAQSNYFAASLR